MKRWRLACAATLLLALAPLAAAAAEPEPDASAPVTAAEQIRTAFAPPSLAEERAALARASLIGSWRATVGSRELIMVFNPDGAYHLRSQSGTFRVAEATLILQPTEAPATEYALDVQDGFFTLTGGDLKQPLKFTRDLAQDTPWRTYWAWLRSVTQAELQDRVMRLITVGLIIIVSLTIIHFLRLVSTFVIYSDWGPLKFIFQRHKSQTRTLHSVALNVVKYFIIFAALGRILAELGVNYTAYVASLSVIGLAIGFGSQGLVQDIVTGLFLILDNQLAVGEMVEISGQTGVVEEVGLRTTRIRNYLGQMVVVPNRNIAQVGNYTRGAVKAVVDVAAKDADSARRMAEELKRLGHEVARQFEGTILSAPAAPEQLRLATGEIFVRVVFDLWPQQQTLIDSQILPRIRDLFAAQQLEIPGNRIAVFYRPPEHVEPVRRRDLRAGIRKLGRWRED